MREYSSEKLDELRNRVKERISEKRYLHTLGVEKTAAILAMHFCPEKETILRAAALLHDIAKEIPYEEQIAFTEADGFRLTDEDLKTRPVLHSFAAPYLIKRDFPDFALPEILSACFNHTVGAPDMSIFDEIIFVADFIEDGRTYSSSLAVRTALFEILSKADKADKLKGLHSALISSINSTLSHLRESGRESNSRMILTKKAFISRI